MDFVLINFILLLISVLFYLYFRAGVSSHCEVSKIGEKTIRKNKKGMANYWLYEQLHKQRNLGIFYHLNYIFLTALAVFFTAAVFSWIPFLKIPVIICGILLGIIAVPCLFFALFYTNKAQMGKPFILFDIVKEYNGRIRFVTALEWLLCILPLGVYLAMLIRFFE